MMAADATFATVDNEARLTPSKFALVNSTQDAAPKFIAAFTWSRNDTPPSMIGILRAFLHETPFGEEVGQAVAQ